MNSNQLRPRRALSPYTLYNNSALLVLNGTSLNCNNALLHSKNTRVSRDPEKGPLGPNSIPGQRWPGNQSNWQIMGPDWPSPGVYFASSWLISRSSLTRNGVWPQWTLFRVTLTRVFLECGSQLTPSLWLHFATPLFLWSDDSNLRCYIATWICFKWTSHLKTIVCGDTIVTPTSVWYHCFNLKGQSTTTQRLATSEISYTIIRQFKNSTPFSYEISHNKNVTHIFFYLSMIW